MELNLQRRGARKLLSSPQAMHAAVMASFPPEATPDTRVLWRVDQEAARTLLYVVSPEEPCFLHMQEQAGWSIAKTWASRAYLPLLDRLAESQGYAFRVTANPTRVVTGADGRKRRVGFFREDEQADWLLRKAQDIGVVLGDPDGRWFKVRQARNRVFERQSQKVTIMQVTFEGSLVVRDAHALQRSLLNGVGRAKAYGCGLLTLAPTAG